MNFIDLENSYIYLSPDADNCRRVAIKSILLDVKENTYYYLTKECRAELMDIRPFDHPAKSEICAVIDSSQNAYHIRNIPVFKFDEFGPHFYQTQKIPVMKCLLKSVIIIMLTLFILIKS